MSFFDTLNDFVGNHAGTLAGIGSIAGALDNADDIRDMGYGVQQHLEQMGNQLNDGSQFQGYGVTSGLGSSTVGQDGSIGLGVGMNNNHATAGNANMAGANSAFQAALGQPTGQANTDWNAIAQGQLDMGNAVNPHYGHFDPAVKTAISNSLADPSQRQSEIFNQLMAIQNPMLDQAQAQQEAREYAMGRGGVAGSAYGGTAEDAAMAKARSQASNEAAINAMQQADRERQMFGQMAGQYGQLANQHYNMLSDRGINLANNAAQFGQLGNQAISNATQQGGMLGQIGNAMAQLGLDQSKLAYMPMQMQMELLKLGQGTGGQAQTGQLTGQDYLAQMLTGGVNANVNAQKVSSELMGNLYDSILDNLGGSSGEGGTMSGIGGLGGMFGDLLDMITGS